MLRLAAVAHGLDDHLDELVADAASDLTEWARRDPWSVEPDEVRTLRLAALVCLEQIDYRSFVPMQGTPMVLRDALTDAEDLSTIAAIVRWASLTNLEVRTPDRLLLSWSKGVDAIASQRALDPAEYHDMLDRRGSLQSHVAALSWTGQDQWRAHIEPLDDAFRACTEHQDVPLVLTLDPKAGEWWRYRLPPGAPASWLSWPIEPRKYVAGRRGRGLRTISYVWELAERPYGLRAMTDQELTLWSELCARQAEFEARREDATRTWRDRHALAADESRRRASESGER